MHYGASSSPISNLYIHWADSNVYPSLTSFFCPFLVKPIHAKTLFTSVAVQYSTVWIYPTFLQKLCQKNTHILIKKKKKVTSHYPQKLKHTDLGLHGSLHLPGYTITHIIKDCLPYLVISHFFILSSVIQCYQQSKPYSLQPNSLSWEPMPWASSQGSDTLKRQALKQSKAKEQIHYSTGWLMFLKWEGPKKEKNLEVTRLQSILHQVADEQHTIEHLPWHHPRTVSNRTEEHTA